MIKVDLHTHTADDPADFIPYTTRALIDRAASFKFAAIAVTLHDCQREIDDLVEYADERGVVLVTGVERTIQGRHVLMLNFPREAESIGSFEDLARFKAAHPTGLVVAPHPFFPLGNCLGGLLERHADLFDAIEMNGFFTAWIDFNRAAVRWARTNNKPILGNSDAHSLSMVGRTYSLVDAAPDADAICAAIKHGKVAAQTAPLSLFEATTYFAKLTAAGLLPSRAGRRTNRRSPEPDEAGFDRAAT